jgi:hydroxyethylthiazole kinase-like uncharacterized protein yjeF
MALEILSSAQMKHSEQIANRSGVDGFSLMKAAGKAVADEILARFSSSSVLVLCGPGNNGGDGFVVASLLKKKKWPVTLACAVPIYDLQGAAARASDLWKGPVLSFENLELPEGGIVVDAVFGTGLSRPIEGEIAEVLETVQQSDCTVIAVDMPSGLDGDTGECQGCTPQADVTVTFFRKKLGHVLMPGMDACGEIVVADIGIPDLAIEALGPVVTETSPESGWGGWVADKPSNSHKYDYGHVLVLGGRHMTGAASLVGKSALRAGAGLCTIAAYSEAAPIYKSYCPSLIVETLDELARFKEHLKDPRRNTVVIGPGAGLENPPALKKAVFDTLAAEPKRVCVLDADALTVFADDVRTFYKAVGPHCILTPHEGEFVRIFPDLTGSKIERAKAAAARTKSVIVLKGPDTVVAMPDGTCVVNVTGNGWLATAGAGDVLAGLIAGFAARSLGDLFGAVCAAVWSHGKAAENLGAGLISADLPDQIPLVLKNILNP